MQVILRPEDLRDLSESRVIVYVRDEPYGPCDCLTCEPAPTDLDPQQLETAIMGLAEHNGISRDEAAALIRDTIATEAPTVYTDHHAHVVFRGEDPDCSEVRYALPVADARR